MDLEREIAERKKMENAIRDSEEHFRSVTDTATDAIISMDHKSNVLLWNKAATNMFGYSSEEAMGKHLPFIMAEEVKKAHMEGVRRVLETGASAIIGGTYESIGRRRDGTNFPVEISLAKLKRHGETNFTGIIRDITKRKESDKKLENFANAKAVLLQEVNHRVKNNLSVIISMLHKEKDLAQEQNIPYYQPLLDDLTGRIQGLLTVHSMLSSADWRPLQVCDLSEQIIKNVLQSSGIENPPEICKAGIVIDSNKAHHLTLVINELATNSVKHAGTDPSQFKIRVDIEQTGNTVHIIFHDNGPGFPEEILLGKYQKIGIGFDLITGIVTKSLRGTIEFRNENGAVADITFPATENKNGEGSE